MKSLAGENESVNESNCDHVIYDLAQTMKIYVDVAVNGF